MVGEAAGGWSFALETPEAGHRDDRLAPPGRDLRSRHTVVDILDTTMDPPGRHGDRARRDRVDDAGVRHG